MEPGSPGSGGRVVRVRNAESVTIHSLDGTDADARAIGQLCTATGIADAA